MASEERQGIPNIFMLGIVRYIWVCMHVDSMGHYGAVGMGRRGGDMQQAGRFSGEVSVLVGSHGCR